MNCYFFIVAFVVIFQTITVKSIGWQKDIIAIKRRRLYAYLTSAIDEKEEKDGTGRTAT